MIIFYHNRYKITEIVSTKTGNFPNDNNRRIVSVLLDFAEKFKDEIIVWSHESEKNNLNLPEIEKLFHHKKLLFSYNPDGNYFDNRLGYVEDSLYIKINKEIKYPTWQMSSRVGAVHAAVLNACKEDLNPADNFDYFLNSLARRAIMIGLFCYSEPKLLLQRNKSELNFNSNLGELFKFTKQHYKSRWVFMLLFNLFIFERKFPFLPFLISLCCKRRTLNPEMLNKIALESNKVLIELGTIDVLIPTIGRKDYLLDVLKCLKAQTYLPKNVIVIEQNPDVNSASELDYIQNEKWPFTIKHHFTHQTGACNARNIGLSMIESELTFLADDDIVFEKDLLEKAMQTFKTTGNEVFLIACHLKTQTVKPQQPVQFPVFGAGHAFVKSSCFKNIKFTMGFEFGFGEDADFGMQLRNNGFDVLYISTTTILHLKAPIGGFRTKPVLKWQNDEIQPKPSPTVMLYRLLYDTKEQIRNYKSMIFIKNLNLSFLFNPFRYIKTFRQKWNRSVYWANELNKQ